jgi:hypothetical protein
MKFSSASSSSFSDIFTGFSVSESSVFFFYFFTCFLTGLTGFGACAFYIGFDWTGAAYGLGPERNGVGTEGILGVSTAFLFLMSLRVSATALLAWD